ncbi:ALBINO3-like protein 2, partial [Trifolium medium]|nr:ALBINO3-like protein 2 [Trifolium medium]
VPPPFPPPFSGKSYFRQISFFEEKRKAVGCPSYAWPLVPFMVQVIYLTSWETFLMNPRAMNLPFSPP